MIKARRPRLLPMLRNWLKCYRIQTPRSADIDDDSTLSRSSLSSSRNGSELAPQFILSASGVHVPNTRDSPSLRAEHRPGKYNLQTQKVHPWGTFILHSCRSKPHMNALRFPNLGFSEEMTDRGSIDNGMPEHRGL